MFDCCVLFVGFCLFAWAVFVARCLYFVDCSLLCVVWFVVVLLLFCCCVVVCCCLLLCVVVRCCLLPFWCCFGVNLSLFVVPCLLLVCVVCGMLIVVRVVSVWKFVCWLFASPRV